MAASDKSEGDRSQSGPDVKIPGDVDLGKALEGGFAALQKVFEGFATAAKQAIGPELLRNLEVAGWLGRVAVCLDETVVALGQSPTAVAGKSGELACYIEQLEAEVKGSKFESQEDTLRQRMEGVVRAIGGGPNADAARTVAEAAGYFRAAANSVGPLPNANGEKFNVTIT